MTDNKDNIEKTEKAIGSVEEALSKSELFIEKNQKLLLIVLGAIVAIVLGVLGYNNYIVKPREAEAQAQSFMAIRYFEKDSLSLALNGNSNYPGFIQIIDDYGSTKAGNLAHYYAGLCYLKMGKFNEAIDMLEDFSSDDKIIGPMAQGAIGDAQMELGNMNEAATSYEKAASMQANDLTTPLFLKKAGLTYELTKQYEKSLVMYERIQKEYFTTFEGGEIEKYIEAVKYKLEEK